MIFLKDDEEDRELREAKKKVKPCVSVDIRYCG
jgi:hypothetical protein